MIVLVFFSLFLFLCRQSHFNSSELELSQSNEEDEVKVDPRWTNINAEVDVVIPMILNHLHSIKIEHLNLPDITETISLVCTFK